MKLDFGFGIIGADNEEKEVMINKNTTEELLVVKKQSIRLNGNMNNSFEIKRGAMNKNSKKSDYD